MRFYLSGRGAVWLARCLREAEVAGSNPAVPTIAFSRLERTFEVKAPLEKVWATMTDVESFPEWAKGVEKEEITSKRRSLNFRLWENIFIKKD